MITKVSATQLKNGFGRYLDEALRDGAVYIQRHSHVIAKIVPVSKEEAASLKKYEEELQKQ